jgi:hypothetical protein
VRGRRQRFLVLTDRLSLTERAAQAQKFPSKSWTELEIAIRAALLRCSECVPNNLRSRRMPPIRAWHIDALSYCGLDCDGHDNELTIAPYIPVIDKSKREDGTFSHLSFDKERDVYICSVGKVLTTTRKVVNDDQFLCRLARRLAKLAAQPPPERMAACVA